MKLKPFGSRVIAKQFDDDMIGSIVVPDEAKRKSLRATIVAVGDDCAWVRPGDTILFGRYARFDIPLRGEEWRDHFIMNEEDILTKIEMEDEDDGD